MVYILVWSFYFGPEWVTGSIYFKDKAQCEEAKQVLMEYNLPNTKRYIECTHVERDKEIQKFHKLSIVSNEIKITEVINSKK